MSRVPSQDTACHLCLVNRVWTNDGAWRRSMAILLSTRARHCAWIPRGMSRFLSDRTKTTTSGTEAFSLGLVSGISELVFIAASS